MTSGATGSHAEPELLIAGRYRLVGRLGAGGFGRVWRAHDTQLAVDVAIKEVVLPPAMAPAEQEERLRRAEREARNAARHSGRSPGIGTWLYWLFLAALLALYITRDIQTRRSCRAERARRAVPAP